MLEFVNGDIFSTDCEAVVNTVNCVGVCGKGIALTFKHEYPGNYNIYRTYCEKRKLIPGGILVVDLNTISNPAYIFNFATKDHWRNPSKLIWIENGLKRMIEEITVRRISSIAIPPLGCGNGGLDWKIVSKYITRILEPLVDSVHIKVYNPIGD